MPNRIVMAVATCLTALAVAPDGTAAATLGAPPFAAPGVHIAPAYDGGIGIRPGIMPGVGNGSPHSYAGISRQGGAGRPGGTGWYHRGFGGSLSPGWGYGFGPNPGSPGR